MSGEVYKEMSGASRTFIEGWISENDLEKDTLNLLEKVLSKTLSKVA